MFHVWASSVSYKRSEVLEAWCGCEVFRIMHAWSFCIYIVHNILEYLMSWFTHGYQPTDNYLPIVAAWSYSMVSQKQDLH